MMAITSGGFSLVSAIITVLLTINTSVVGLSFWFLKRYVERNDKEHDELYERTNQHNKQIAVNESHIETIMNKKN